MTVIKVKINQSHYRP